MIDFIANPRRALRLPLRCAARVESYGLACEGHLEDLGAHGCRLVGPTRLADSTHVLMHITTGGAPGALSVGGTVVWGEPQSPWRHGVAFDAPDHPRTEAWFDEVASRNSELLHLVRVPDRIDLKARVYVTTPPRAPPRLGDEEAVVLKLACDQPTLAQLQRVLAPDWSRAQRALFALLGRGALTLDPAEAGDPQGWRDHLEAERRLGRHYN